MPQAAKELCQEEQELLEELLRALEVMRYGSILLTVHNGHLVEIQKTERIRRKTNTPTR